MGLKTLLSLKLGDTIKVVEGPTSLEARRRGVDHEDEPAAWDDVTGEPLVRGEVLKARALEIEHIRNKKVWDKITRKEALKNGMKVIQTRWLDRNNRDR